MHGAEACMGTMRAHAVRSRTLPAPQNTLLLRVEGKPPMVKLCDFG